MSPKKLNTAARDRAWARSRHGRAAKYLEAADLMATEDGQAINVSIGNAVLAGIAAGDAICATALGEAYTGPDHASAADLLQRVDLDLGNKLRTLVRLKANAHYGNTLLTPRHRQSALRAARALVDAARARTT